MFKIVASKLPGSDSFVRCPLSGLILTVGVKGLVGGVYRNSENEC